VATGPNAGWCTSLASQRLALSSTYACTLQKEQVLRTGLLAPVSEHWVGGGWGEREVEQGVEEELGVEKVHLRE